MKWLLTILLLTATPVLASPSNLACKVVAIHVESRGEPLRSSRGVLDVIEHRMRNKGQSACQVVKAPGQFPWAKKQKKWHYSVDMLRRYERVNSMESVVGSKFLFFNHVPHKFGRNTKKIGNLHFAQ